MSKGKRASADQELDLVPIMNLVTILIPFLLMSAQFITLATIESSLPAIGPATAAADEDPNKKPLNLSIAITGAGFRVLGNAGPLKANEGEDGSLIPCLTAGCPDANSYDVKELTKLLGQVKDEYPEELNVILIPDSTLQYEILVLAMDASREDESNKIEGKSRLLFPSVVIAGGVGN